MTHFTFANNINTSLSAAVTTTATTILLASTAGLPASIPAGGYLAITLNDQATRQNVEVVYATAITGSTLTVIRAQEGTAALAWNIGDYVYSAPTAGQMANVAQLDTFTSSLTANGWKEFPDPNSPSGKYIEQWGNLDLSPTPGVGTNINFPIPFPNACVNVSVTAASPSGQGAQHVWVTNTEGNPTYFTAFSDTANGGCFWRANGY